MGTTLGVSRVFIEGGSDGQTIWLEGNISGRTVGVGDIIVSYATPECIGACIEEPPAGQFSSIEAPYPMLGAAVVACELAGLLWSAVNLSRLTLHATGKRNAGRPEMLAAEKAG